MELKLSEDNKTILLSSSDNLYIIKGVVFKNYKMICEYQKELLTILLEHNGSLGDIFEDEKTTNIIKNINKLMKLDKETLRAIEDLDINQYFNLYFSQNTMNDEDGRKRLTRTENNREILDILPSYLAVINGINFFTLVSKALEIIKSKIATTNSI